MALETLIGGRYSGTLNAADVGICEEGFEIQQDTMAELINQSDAYGDSVIDWLYRGTNVFCQWNSLAYKAGSISAFMPYSSLGAMGVIGRLASDIATAFVLTATAGTPAATTPATLTASKALLAANAPGRLLFSSKLRRVPVRLQFLPVDVGGGVVKHFVTTALLVAITGLLAGSGLA